MKQAKAKDDPRNIQKRDFVRILVPKVIKYVGYENSIHDVYDEVIKALSLKSGEENSVEKLSLSELSRVSNRDCPNEPYVKMFKGIEERVQKELGFEVFNYREHVLTKLAHEIAYEIVGQRMATANQERKKFEETNEKLLGEVREVFQVKYHKTGIRVAPSSGMRGYFEPEWEHEPGYLEDEKTVKTIFINRLVQLKKDRLQIDTEYVEKVIPFSNMTYISKWLKKYWEVMTIRQKCDAFFFCIIQHLASDDCAEFILGSGDVDKIRTSYDSLFYDEQEELEFDVYFKEYDINAERYCLKSNW